MTCYTLPATPRAVCGPGARTSLAAEVQSHAGDVLLVSETGLARTSVLDQVRGVLPGDARVSTFLAPAGEPTLAVVDRGAERVRTLRDPLVIGVGGGSALDTAKLIAALRTTRDSIAAYTLGRATFGGRSPAIMLPTTAGTGAEATRTCIVADESGRKLWVFADVLLPDAAILDGELCTGLPRGVTVTTGLDAFVHGLEAATAQTATGMSRALGVEAMRLARIHLETAATDGGDLDARQAMLEASLLAGCAINAAGTGIAHNIGHALGSLYHVPHGLAVAVGLDASIDWTAEIDGPGLAAAAAAFPDVRHTSGLPGLFRDWLARLDLDAIVRTAGLPHPDRTALAHAMASDENAPMAANSARVPTDPDLADLAQRTCQAWRSRTGGPVGAD